MPSLERVKEIMRLTRDINDADGIVEVTQALGSLTAYMATIMIDIRELLIDQNQISCKMLVQQKKRRKILLNKDKKKRKKKTREYMKNLKRCQKRKLKKD